MQRRGQLDRSGVGDYGTLQHSRGFLGSHGAKASIALQPGVLECLCPLTRAPCASRGAKSPSYPTFVSPFIYQILFPAMLFWLGRKNSLTTK